MVYLFCNVGWMEYYGSENDDDNIVGGGSYVDREGHGFEVCNFAPYENQIYGYVRPPRPRIGINRLGAGTNDDFITIVNVIWTATLQKEEESLLVGTKMRLFIESIKSLI